MRKITQLFDLLQKLAKFVPCKISTMEADKSQNKRLTALDVMRGITIVGMIIVNNAGGPESYSALRHSDWNGLTPCDLVFPFFLFIMGITTYLSLAKSGFRATGGAMRKILRRTLTILLICWALHWFDNVCSGRGLLDFGHLRLTGVLTRIALCYCVVSVLALYASRRAMMWIAAALLAVYGAALLLFNGYANDLSNVNALVDRALLSTGHLYTKRPVDPEGLFGTIPAIAHTIIGFCCGALLRSGQPLGERLLRLMVAAVLLMVAGYVLSALLPVNKRVWSPSYVLVSCGMAAAMLATLSYFIDMRGAGHWFEFFRAFGVNPLFLYVGSEALAVVIGSTGAKTVIYSAITTAVPDPKLASAIYSVGLMLLMGLAAMPLYRKKIYIKI